jgi:hypothetical protein
VESGWSLFAKASPDLPYLVVGLSAKKDWNFCEVAMGIQGKMGKFVIATAVLALV